MPLPSPLPCRGSASLMPVLPPQTFPLILAMAEQGQPEPPAPPLRMLPISFKGRLHSCGLTGKRLTTAHRDQSYVR
jgi:hypothetical protein